MSDAKTRPRPQRGAETRGNAGREAAEGFEAGTRGREGGASRLNGGESSRAAASPASGGLLNRTRLPEHMRRGVRLRVFAESTVFDFLLVAVVASALVLTVSFGFHSAWAYRGNVLLVVGLVTPLLLALYGGTWSKKALVPSAVTTAAIAAAYIIGAVALSPEPALFVGGKVNDAEGNYAVFAMALVVVTVVVFLLSRRTIGLFFLLVAAIVACGYVQFIWRDWVVAQPGVMVTFVALLGIGMLFIYQCYKQSIYSASRLKRTSFGGAFAFSLVVAAACVAVGVAVFYGVVATVDLHTPEVKLFFEYVSPPVGDLSDDYEKKRVEGEDTSSNTNSELNLTGAEGEGSGGGDGAADGSSGADLLAGTPMRQLAQRLAGQDSGGDSQSPDELSYHVYELTMMITAILVVLLVLAAIFLRRSVRSVRLRLMAGRSGAYQVWRLYEFLLSRFERMRMAKPDHLTPLEFAVGYSRAMLPFTRDTGGVDFIDVSQVYQDVAYGGKQPSADDLAVVKAYYRAFFRNARRHVGWPKWLLWKFWRI